MRSGPPLPWYLNPYIHLAVSSVLITAAEVLLKKGALVQAGAGGNIGVLGLGALAAPATWLGIVLLTVSFLSWLHVLRTMPLTQAYALINIVHILVPAAAWLFLNETISTARMIGIVLVLAGTTLVAAPAARAEEEL